MDLGINIMGDWEEIEPSRAECAIAAWHYAVGSDPIPYYATIRDLMLAGFCCLFMIGCGSSEVVSPEVQARASELSALLTSSKTVETKSDELLKAVESNTTALAAIKSQIEALQVVSKTVNSEEVIKSAPNPPAKANTTPDPLKVAQPGDSSETLTELATRLYGQGVAVHMKTEEQLRAIDAQLTGTKSTPVQYQTRPTYSQPSGTVCINGQCFTPQRVSRRRR